MRELAGIVLIILLIPGMAYAAGAPGNNSNVNGGAGRTGDIRQGISEQIKLHPRLGTAETVSGQFIIEKGSSKSEKALEFVAQKQDAFRLNQPEQELKLQSERTDHLGLSHLRFQQVYRDVPVWGSQIIIHFSDDETVYLAGGQVIPSPEFDVIPSISEEEAVDITVDNLKDRFDASGAVTESELVIYPNDGDPRLTRLVTVTDSDNPSVRWRVFVDARTGEVLFRFNDIHFDGPDTGSGTDVIGVNHVFPIYDEGGTFKLRDATRVAEIRTYIDYLNGGSLSEDPDGDKVWDDNPDQPAEVAGHVYAAWAYDYFKTTFGRESFDGLGSNVIVNIHDPRYTNNAYWNGVSVNFGDGDGVNYLPFSGSADVVAHELTHGVTQYNGNGGLIYAFQSGALNESYSDVFGAAVDPGDWLLGEDIRISAPGFIRSMENPNLRNHPMHMNDYRYYSIATDNGGVHINSGIPNHTYYRVVDVYGMDRARTDSVWYRTLTTYLTPSSGFYFWAGMLTQSAIDLYGFNSPEHIAIESALADVGLGTVFALPQSFAIEALLGTVGSNSLWIHNKGGYAGASSMSYLPPTLPGLTLSPGPGYQASISTGDSSEFLLTFDATAFTQCNLGSYRDTLEFSITGPLVITDLRVPVLVGVGLNSSEQESNSLFTQCANLVVDNAAYANTFSRGGYDALYESSFLIGLRDGTDTTVYRSIFGADGFAPVDSFSNAAGSTSYILSTSDGRMQGEVTYRWEPVDAFNCEFFIVDYMVVNDCDTSLDILTGIVSDFDIGSDRTGYVGSQQMVYMYDTGTRATAMALLGATARNLRAINNPTQVYGGSFTDGLAYREMAEVSNSDGTATDDWSIMLTFDQNQLGSGDTLQFTVAMMYSTSGVAGLDAIYEKANTFAGYGGPTYLAGDANGDEVINISDASYIVNYVFKGGPAPDPLEAADADCDESVNVADAVYIINFVFKGGPSPGC